MYDINAMLYCTLCVTDVYNENVVVIKLNTSPLLCFFSLEGQRCKFKSSSFIKLVLKFYPVISIQKKKNDTVTTHTETQRCVFSTLKATLKSLDFYTETVLVRVMPSNLCAYVLE